MSFLCKVIIKNFFKQAFKVRYLRNKVFGHSSLLTGLNLNGHILLCRRGALAAAAQVHSFFLGLSSLHRLDFDHFLLRAALLSSDCLVILAVLNIFCGFPLLLPVSLRFLYVAVVCLGN